MAVWAVSLLAYGASPPSPNCRILTYGIRSLIGPVLFRAIQTFQCSTSIGNIRRQPESCFGENQLLPSSVSFSLQPTTHPKMLNNLRVRSSIRISTNFNLVMGSSPGFGSDTFDKRTIHTRFRYDSGGRLLSRAECINSLAHSSIGTLSWSRTTPTPCRHAVSVLFHSPHRGSFHLSLTVLVHYRSEKVCSLTS